MVSSYNDLSIIASVVSCAAAFCDLMTLLTPRLSKLHELVFFLLILGVLADGSKAYIYTNCELMELGHLS